MELTKLLDVSLCSWVQIYQYFEATLYLYFQGILPGRWKVSESGRRLTTLRRNLMLPDFSGDDGSDFLPDVCQPQPENTVLHFKKPKTPSLCPELICH